MSESRQPTTRIIAVIALVVGALALVAPSVLARPTSTGTPIPTAPGAAADPSVGISATGTARIVVVPDQADFSVGVDLQAATATKALADASTKMNAVIAALRSAGVAEKDLRTSSINVSPVYDWNDGDKAPTLVGYQASEQLAVTVRKLDETGKLIDAAIAAGGTTLGGVTFSVADPTAATDEARSAAVADARRRAEGLAQAAGVRVGGPLSIVETTSTPPAPVYREAMAAADGATTVLPGTTEVVVQVHVVFAIS